MQIKARKRRRGSDLISVDIADVFRNRTAGMGRSPIKFGLPVVGRRLSVAAPLAEGYATQSNRQNNLPTQKRSLLDPRTRERERVRTLEAADIGLSVELPGGGLAVSYHTMRGAPLSINKANDLESARTGKSDSYVLAPESSFVRHRMGTAHLDSLPIGGTMPRTASQQTFNTRKRGGMNEVDGILASMEQEYHMERDSDTDSDDEHRAAVGETIQQNDRTEASGRISLADEAIKAQALQPLKISTRIQPQRPSMVGRGRAAHAWEDYITITAPFRSVSSIKQRATERFRSVMSLSCSSLPGQPEGPPVTVADDRRQGEAGHYGQKADMRSARTLGHLVRKESAANAADRQARLLRSKGLPVSRAATSQKLQATKRGFDTTGAKTGVVIGQGDDRVGTAALSSRQRMILMATSTDLPWARSIGPESKTGDIVDRAASCATPIACPAPRRTARSRSRSRKRPATTFPTSHRSSKANDAASSRTGSFSSASQGQLFEDTQQACRTNEIQSAPVNRRQEPLPPLFEWTTPFMDRQEVEAARAIRHRMHGMEHELEESNRLLSSTLVQQGQHNGTALSNAQGSRSRQEKEAQAQADAAREHFKDTLRRQVASKAEHLRLYDLEHAGVMAALDDFDHREALRQGTFRAAAAAKHKYGISRVPTVMQPERTAVLRLPDIVRQDSIGVHALGAHTERGNANDKKAVEYAERDFVGQSAPPGAFHAYLAASRTRRALDQPGEQSLRQDSLSDLAVKNELDPVTFETLHPSRDQAMNIDVAVERAQSRDVPLTRLPINARHAIQSPMHRLGEPGRMSFPLKGTAAAAAGLSLASRLPGTRQHDTWKALADKDIVLSTPVADFGLIQATREYALSIMCKNTSIEKRQIRIDSFASLDSDGQPIYDYDRGSGITLRARYRTSPILPGEQRRIVLLVHTEFATAIHARILFRTSMGALRSIEVQGRSILQRQFAHERERRLDVMRQQPRSHTPQPPPQNAPHASTGSLFLSHSKLQLHAKQESPNQLKWRNSEAIGIAVDATTVAAMQVADGTNGGTNPRLFRVSRPSLNKQPMVPVEQPNLDFNAPTSYEFEGCMMPGEGGTNPEAVPIVSAGDGPPVEFVARSTLRSKASPPRGETPTLLRLGTGIEALKAPPKTFYKVEAYREGSRTRQTEVSPPAESEDPSASMAPMLASLTAITSTPEDWKRAVGPVGGMGVSRSELYDTMGKSAISPKRIKATPVGFHFRNSGVGLVGTSCGTMMR